MLSKPKSSFTWPLLVIALAIPFTGCAAAYHAYSECCVPYLYCAPRPLSYLHYDGCHCPTPGASQYIPESATALPGDAPERDAVNENSAPPKPGEIIAPAQE